MYILSWLISIRLSSQNLMAQLSVSHCLARHADMHMHIRAHIHTNTPTFSHAFPSMIESHVFETDKRDRQPGAIDC